MPQETISFRAPLTVRCARLDAAILTPTGKQVLIALATFANPDGTSCFPTTTTISAETGLHRATVCAAMAKLRSLGAIVPLTTLQEARSKRIAISYVIEIDHLPATPKRVENRDRQNVASCRPGRQGHVVQGDKGMSSRATLPSQKDHSQKERERTDDRPTPSAPPKGGLGGSHPVRDAISQALAAHKIPCKDPQVDDWERTLSQTWDVPPKPWAATAAITWIVEQSRTRPTWYEDIAPLLGLWQVERGSILNAAYRASRLEVVS